MIEWFCGVSFLAWFFYFLVKQQNANDGCVVLFELWRWYNEFMASGLIDREAMMNAIYLNHPQYAVQHNRREQEGLNDVGAQFWRWLGYDVEPEGQVENLIRFNPDKGGNYLLF